MKLSLKKLTTGFLVLTLALVFGLNSAHAQDGTVVDVLKSNEEVSTFAELLEETQLPELLNQEGPFTVVAPTDEAFQKMEVDTDQLKEDPEQLQNLVVSHLFRGEVASDEVEPNMGVKVKEGDVKADNGVVHVVEDVVQVQE